MTQVLYPKLKDYCIANTDDLLLSLSERYNTEITFSKLGDYLYVDNGAPVLAVAHLDTVSEFRGSTYKYFDKDNKPHWVTLPSQPGYNEYHLNSHKQHKRRGCYTRYSQSHVVQSISLDDRLGLYMITDILPEMGIVMDFLFTTGEERGASSAAGFTLPEGKTYNWICEFDRRGLEPVLYEYDTPELRQLLSAFGYKVTYGSFSDICELEHLEVKGINFAIGYNQEHTNFCVASMETVKSIAKEFVAFYCANCDTPMPHTPYSRRRYAGASAWADAWDDDEDWERGPDGVWHWIGKGSTYTSSATSSTNSNDLNNAYFRDNASWDDLEDDTEQDKTLEGVECDFCGADAVKTVRLDTDYNLCAWCIKELGPGGEDDLGDFNRRDRYLRNAKDTKDFLDKYSGKSSPLLSDGTV